MPELPEIEHLRRTLEPHLLGARVESVRLHRPDIVRLPNSRQPMQAVGRHNLLAGAVIRKLERLGKSLAIVGGDGRTLVLHMGMTGRVTIVPDGLSTRSSYPHLHCEWRLRSARRRRLRMLFQDPRRFGGLWPFESVQDLHDRVWSRMGPDALTISAASLRERLARTRQPVKAALLNQSMLAGLGNIYADEALFRAGISPKRVPSRLARPQWAHLSRAIRSVLLDALASGGSTIRDYVDSSGRQGSFAVRHRVYGRGGLPCLRCGTLLRVANLGQRTTVYCARCQR
jgi:formamidopyrimidine-DNA glycosylase